MAFEDLEAERQREVRVVAGTREVGFARSPSRIMPRSGPPYDEGIVEIVKPTIHREVVGDGVEPDAEAASTGRKFSMVRWTAPENAVGDHARTDRVPRAVRLGVEAVDEPLEERDEPVGRAPEVEVQVQQSQRKFRIARRAARNVSLPCAARFAGKAPAVLLVVRAAT